MLPNFVAKVTIPRLSCLSLNGRLIVEEFAALRSRLIGSVGRDAAALFAEPVLTHKGDDVEIAWYSEHAGEPVRLETLDDELRRSAAGKLQARLAAIEPLLATDAGPLLGRALYLAGSDSILAVGQEPLLIQWGVLPQGLSGDDRASLERQFAATLGPYAPFPAPQIAPKPARQSASPASTGRPAAALPGREPSRVSWAAAGLRPIAIATGVAAILALLLALPGVLATPVPIKADDDGIARAQDITRAMADKVDQARSALAAAQCNPDGSIGPVNGGGSGQLPPAPVPIRQGDAQPQGSMSLVARRATESVVFILTCTGRATWAEDHKDDKEASSPLPCPDPDGSGTAGDLVVAGSGSGFFIAPKRIATNTHVIKDAKAVFVTSRTLGRVSRGEVLASTVKTRVADPDFAIIGIDLDNSPAPIGLTSATSRLQNVVAAGYPGVIISEDAQLGRLLKGDSSAAPELTTFPGFVTLTMNQGQAVPLIFSSAAIGHGNSGGPLLDLCGRAVGVNTLGWSGSAEDTGYKVNVAEGATALAAFLGEHQIDGAIDPSACTPALAETTSPQPIAPGK